MDEDTYRRRLAGILGDHTGDLTARLRAIAEASAGPAGERVAGVVVDVFPGEHDEGAFDVWARFDGPDVFALNRPIDDVRHLFGVTYGERGFEPDVPAFGAGEPDFALAEVIVDVVASWVEPVWAAVAPPSVPAFEVTRADGC
ncbi:DUF6389 family protein [Nocardioides sp. LHD-245]|uniref:DUF6389 family protein n=1 Tax=Nocardioides sp. LHD-245 TaxID=3051387 RepID=UPI0027DFF2C2|nr:DUF6389 family protein [Nocardioides sp. LHD-245]